MNPQVETLSHLRRRGAHRPTARHKKGDAVRANSIAAKVKKAGLFFDRYCIKGDPGIDPLSFYGLNARLTGAQVLGAGTNGGPMTLDLLDQALDAVAGSNDRKIIICNKVVRRKITALLRAAAGGASLVEIGPQAREYDGARSRCSTRTATSSPSPFDYSTSAHVTTSLYVVRRGDVYGEFLQGDRADLVSTYPRPQAPSSPIVRHHCLGCSTPAPPPALRITNP